MPNPRKKSLGQFHCPSCQHGLPPSVAPTSRRVRLAMHCGYLPRPEWKPGRSGLPPVLNGEPYTEDVCPGWLVRQPEIAEAGEAYEALEAGILQRLDPRNSRVITLAALAMRRSVNRFQLNNAATPPTGSGRG